MPHGGYHGVVKMGGKIVQQGSPAGAPPGQGGIYNPQGYATEMAGSSAPSTTESIEKQIEDKKKQIELLNIAQSGFGANAPSMGFPMSGQEGKLKFTIDPTTGKPVPGEEILGSFPFNIPNQGLEGVDAKGLATLQNIQNQQLNNLLIQQAQAEARDRILGKATPTSQVDVDQGFGIVPTLRKADLTGFEGGFLGLNIPELGATPSIGMSGVATLKNPFTGEILFSTDPDKPGSRQDELLKARLGLTTPQYNEFIAQLYDANPELYEKTFPIASGKALTPLLLRLIGENLGSGGVTELVDPTTGAVFTPTGGTVRPSDVGIPAPGAGGSSRPDVTERRMPLFGQVPDQFREGFLKFYNEYEGPKIGGMAITPVTLPDGSVIEFGDTGSARIFREYLESLGISQPPATGVDVVERIAQPTGISGFDVDKFYASLPQYTQQGIMAPVNLSRFTDALRMFPGATV